jgi:hypothetical protein
MEEEVARETHESNKTNKQGAGISKGYIKYER